MIMYSMSTTQFTETSNQVKEAFLEAMVKEEIITKEQSDEMNQYCMVVSEKGYFGKIWDKIFLNKQARITVVKIIN